MRLKLGSRSFAPPVWATLVTVALVGGCIALGYWQIGRGREKQALIEAFHEGSDTTVVLTGAVDGLPRYQHVSARGRFDTQRQILLDNMPGANGAPGYRVLTPLARVTGATLLVDRGWVPLGASRAVLPDISAATDDEVEVSGRLDALPQPGLRLGAAQLPGASGWPRVLNFPLQADVAAVLGLPVESRILLLDAESPFGYERKWRPSLEFGPERHFGYAIQWFALALAVLAIFVATNLRRDPDHAEAAR